VRRVVARQARATCGGEAGACNVVARQARATCGGEAGACHLWWALRRIEGVCAEFETCSCAVVVKERAKWAAAERT
jgi:hypothetical protein